MSLIKIYKSVKREEENDIRQYMVIKNREAQEQCK